MAAPTLPLPEEPTALKASTRALLEQSPAEGLRLVAEGEWIAAPLWAHWRSRLTRRGMSRAEFLEVVVGYRNELRLWVMGERPWSHCVSGLAGRVVRRLAAPAGARRPTAETAKPRTSPPSSTPPRRIEMRNAHQQAWPNVLAEVGIDPRADVATLRAEIDRLGLEHDVVATNADDCDGVPGAVNYAIVWAGGRPRDPEVPFGEATSGSSLAAALGEALARFLVKDPGYPAWQHLDLAAMPTSPIVVVVGAKS